MARTLYLNDQDSKLLYFRCYFSTLSQLDVITSVISIKDYSQATFLDFLNFSDRFTSTKLPDQWTKVAICINKTTYNCKLWNTNFLLIESQAVINCYTKQFYIISAFNIIAIYRQFIFNFTFFFYLKLQFGTCLY